MNPAYTNPAFAIIRENISSTDAVTRLAALLDAPEILADDAVFLAYCELPNIGPANDFDGVRSTALKLKWDWELNVLAPAQAIRAKRA